MEDLKFCDCGDCLREFIDVPGPFVDRFVDMNHDNPFYDETHPLFYFWHCEDNAKFGMLERTDDLNWRWWPDGILGWPVPKLFPTARDARNYAVKQLGREKLRKSDK